jgi:hypothetical protein
MAGVLQHLRSSTLDKRPNPASMVDGQVAINYASGAPGMFFKDSNGDLVKVGPVHVGSSAPNVSPASGGTAGNSIGEQWLDNSGGTYVFKIWDGSAWRSEAGEFVNTTGDTMTGALGVIAGSASTPGLFFSGDANSGLYSPGADQVAVSTGGTKRLLVDATGIVHFEGTSTSVFINPSSDTNTFQINRANSTIVFNGTGTSKISKGGVSPGNLQIESQNSSIEFLAAGERMRITSAGLVGIGTSSPQSILHLSSTGPIITLTRNNNADAGSGAINFATSDNTVRWQVGTNQAVGAGFEINRGANTNNAVYIDTSNRVGIGTTSPTEKLHVDGNAIFKATNSYIGLQNASGTSTGYMQGQSSFLAIAGGSGSSNTIAFYPASTETMRIDSSGRLLVGTSSSSSTSAFVIQGYAGVSAGAGEISITRGGTPSAADQGLGTIRFQNNNGNTGAQIDAFSEGSWTAGSNHRSKLTFSTTADGASSPTERLRITSAGLVGIGTSAPAELMQLRGSGATKLLLSSADNTTDRGIYFGTSDNTVLGYIKQEYSTGLFEISSGSGAYTSGIGFRTGGVANRVFIDSSGRVGIGTTSPGELLSVYGNVAILSSNRIKTTDSGGNLTIQGGGTFPGGHIILNGGNGSDNIIFNRSGASASTVETARIDSSGRLLVGTSSGRAVGFSSLQAPVQVETTTAAAYTAVNNTNDANGCYVSIAKTRGTSAGAVTAVQNNDELGAIRISGSDGTGFVVGAQIIAAVDGTPGTNDLPTRLVFSTTADGASSPTERMRIDSSGRVGIGTASPGSYEVSADNLVISDSGDAGISIVSGTSNSGNLFFASGTVGNDMFRGYIIYSHTSHGLSFGTNAQERFRCDSSGRLLVGTSTVTTTASSATNNLLAVESANNYLGVSFTANCNDSNGSYLVLKKSRGTTAGSTTVVQSGDEIGNIFFEATDGSASRSAAAIRAFVDGTPGSADMPGRLVFSTTADGASSPTERMRIASGGGFKVSNTGAYNLGSDIHEINHNVVGSAAFHVYHSAASTPYGYYFKFTGANPNDATSYVFGSFDNVNANIYTIYSNGTVSARSDAKFKKNIETTRNGYLEDLAQLRVVKYNWYNHDDDTPKELGFIAQEVEQVFPGLVSTVPDKDDQGNETGEVSKSIKTSVFTPMLVKALQEALERIETLEAEVAALKAQ